VGRAKVPSEGSSGEAAVVRRSGVTAGGPLICGDFRGVIRRGRGGSAGGAYRVFPGGFLIVGAMAGSGAGQVPAYLRAVTDVRGWLEGELCRAILMACKDDAALFGRDACERSIMFRIGRYLAPAVEERWPGRLWVDCEYNRIADDIKARVVKQVTGLGPIPDDKRSVFPDLIVHDRSGSSRDHNILVVEAKKSPGGRRGVAYDHRKLKAYQRDLQYQYAVYIELRRQPRWQWMDRDLQLRPVTDPTPGASGDDSSAAGRRDL